MSTEIKITLPDSIALACGGSELTFKTADLPTETMAHCLNVGLARVASYSYSSRKAAAKKAADESGQPFVWLDKTHTALVDEIRTRFMDGDWSRASGGGFAVSDPVTKHAHDAAKAFMVAKWRDATGVKTIADLYAKADKAREYINESRNDKTGDLRYTWDESAVATFVEATEDKLHFRRDAEAAIAKLSDTDVDLGDLI